jgi:GNAT superfamily N-acetyltransferase
MSRGVGTVLLNYILGQAKAQGVRFQAEFVATDRNRVMLVTYRLGGFRQVQQEENLFLFEHDLQHLQAFPPYITVVTDAQEERGQQRAE